MSGTNYSILQSMCSGVSYNQIIRAIPYGAIPVDVGNCDYDGYLTWTAAGNTAQTVQYITPITPSNLICATQAYVDNAGVTKLDITAVATVAQMEASTSNVVYVSPLVESRSPSAAKVWVSFNANGTINASYNVASVVKNSVGLWTITFTVPFSSALYMPSFTCDLTLASLLSFGVKAGTALAGSIQVTTSTLLGILADPNGKLYFVGYGDQ